MPYIDSNISIYPVLYSAETEPKVKKAKQILLSIGKAKLPAYTSTLTWDEIVWVMSKPLGRSEGTYRAY